MQKSNTYIIIFTLIMTIFFGTLLSFTRMKLAPIQKVQVEIDTKKKILGAVMDISSLNPEEILETYENKMSSKVLDIKGNELSQEDGNIYIAEEVNISKNYKINKDERLYPVFMYSNDGSSIDFYIFPMFGNGLWDWISGFIALDKDLNEIVGVAFDHKTETPGLGARISSDEIQERYKGKKIFNELGDLVSIKMLKKENNKMLTLHEVDGMSGATITANGLNDMLKNYLDCYLPFIKKNQSQILLSNR
ncbi:MAG: NADH:ubiquinone reductase (Na(+)-transporting) subunit C [Rhodothermaeota bacterium MED-G16]|nr:MAG: NADH:ubiquinone reductase (Na(+)-transporting) subunit C [Rhodothermaeota bacterium MED-G16]